MTKISAAILCIALAIAASSQHAVSQTIERTLKSQGEMREYKLHIPVGLPDNAPLVIALHGYGSTNAPERFGMDAAADRHGFAVCYPLGVKDRKGKTCWNVGYPFQEDMKMDDIRFLRQLVRHLQKEYGFSKKNVFCTGMSNGGDMCYVLASRCPGLFTALAPVAGFMSVCTLREDKSQAAVPLLEIHGTMDRTTRWEGDLDNEGGWGAYLPVPVAVQYFAAKGKCTRYECDTLAGNTSSINKVARHIYSNGTDGTEVWLYECIGGKHSWSKTGVDTCETIWEFFSKFLQ